jgi:uncharacterized protein (TIGR01777 family)
MKTILIAGGSGFIGTNLRRHFIDAGHTVYILSRKPKRKNQIYWNAHNKQIEGKHLEKIEIIINLAGAGIADKRWTKERKSQILNSRIDTIEYLFISATNFPKLEHFITASGIDCYGFGDPEKNYTETDNYGTDFLSNVVRQWEEKAHLFDSKFKTTILRLPIVLDAVKGALPKMAALIKKWLGSPIGSGKQNMNWVHIDDLTTIFKHVIDNSLTGTYNVVGGSNTNEDFTKTLAKTLHKRLILPNIPPFMMKLILGEMAILLLNGNSVSGKKLTDTGFTYQHTELEETLKSIYSL